MRISDWSSDVCSSDLEEKLDELRKGRSRVLETEHTIILNWSPSIFDVISELVIANQSRRNPRIVIMANKDKVEMEDEIATKVTEIGRASCRERGCQYVWIWGVAGDLKKKNTTT